MRFFIALTAWLLCGVILCQAVQPAEAQLAAYRDVMTLAPEDRVDTRYLWVSGGDGKQRWGTFVAVSGHLQGISWQRRIVPPVLILQDNEVRQWPQAGKEDWPRLVLLRVNLRQLGIDPRTWDRLGDPALEPLFHVSIPMPYPSGQNKDGSRYRAGEERVNALAPWLARPLPLQADDPVYLNAALGLSIETGYSQCPIVEADNFVWQSAIQFDRKAGYYDFLGTKDLDDFNRLVGFDEKDSLRYALPLLEAVAKSGVTVHPRRVEVWEKTGGRYVRTKDQVGQRAIGNRDPTDDRNLGRDALEFDAFEIYANSANGWWKKFLATNKGVRQDSAPDGVGYNHQSPTNDGKIHVNLACDVCHDSRPGNGGMQPFKPFFRELYAVPGPVALGALSRKKLAGFEDEYLSTLSLDLDQRRYIAAVFEATGTTPDVYAAQLLESFLRWDRHVDRKLAAERYGVTEDEMVKALDRQLKTFGILDSHNAAWLKPKERQGELGVDQWAVSYNLGQLALRGLPAWPPEMRRKYPVRAVK